MNAADDRTKARDLYDLGFLVESHGDSFSTDQILRADEFSRNYQGLADRYRRAFSKDPLLKGVTTADDRALVFRIGVAKQMYLRRQPVVEQAVPSTWSLADVLALHKIWLESDGRQGSCADLSDRSFRGTALCGMSFEKADLRRATFTATDLRHVSFRNADLRQASFEECDLQWADFDGANLAGLSVDNSVLGPISKEFADALAEVVEPSPSSSVPVRLVSHRAEFERDFGPSR